MIVVDTSVWIEHFRRGCRVLMHLLAHDRVMMHPYIVGELACGHLRKRADTISLLQTLPHAKTASDADTLYFLERQKLYGKGLGYIDLHLLAAVVITGSQLWSMDKALQRQADALHIAFVPPTHVS